MDDQNQLGGSYSFSLALAPKYSQIVLIAIAGVSALSFFYGFYLYGNDKKWLLPIVIGLLCLFITCIGWWRSQRSIDLANSRPTEIYSPSGFKISTDVRLFESTIGFNHFHSVIDILFKRKPLPDASGMILPDGSVVPNSESESNALVNKINTSIKLSIQKIESDIKSSFSEDESKNEDGKIDFGNPDNH